MIVTIRRLCQLGPDQFGRRRFGRWQFFGPRGPYKRQGAKGARKPPPRQICFSGISTTSPSSAGVTLIWQVRRERTGSGS